MANLLNRRFYVKQSFEIYGGVSGLLDFGDLGVKMQNNILTLWRSHFVKEDDMLEACCSSLTPE
ncbi:Glycine--tRNA ligase, partial [Stegodyphus mimosarum]